MTRRWLARWVCAMTLICAATSTATAQRPTDVDESLSGFHVQAGAEYQVLQWVAVGGEVGRSTVADAIGQGGVSAHFNEDNLGGTSVRLKISVGR